ncbi:MAG: sugar transferase [Deltaproteobacteria bacterium]|nr:sugar transferase [Deltaproteobacteria bacterium]
MFSIHTTRGAITIFLADLVISFLLFEFFFWVLPRSSILWIYGPFQEHLAVFVFTLIVLLSLFITSLYSFTEQISPVELFKRIIIAFLISCGYIVTLSFFIRDLALINWRLLPPLSAIFLCLFFFRYILYYDMPKNRNRVLIIGANDLTHEIIKESQKKAFRDYEIVGIISAVENQVGTTFHGVPVLGPMEEINEALQRVYPVNIIVVTLRDRRGKLPVHNLLKLKTSNIRVQEGSTFYEEVKKKIIIDEYLKPSWFLFEEGFCQTPIHRTIKHTQGIIVSFCLLTILSPLLLLIVLLIKLDTPGPAFYRQERVGFNGRIFHLLKFRSMVTDAEGLSGPTFAQKDDPRITRVGRVIRKLRLDEVPQFINVFKGDMDMVGPRPERPVFVKEMEKSIPYYNLRHSVRPGLTGWAQVNYSYGDNMDASKEKLQYDLYYVKHSTWLMDLAIMFLTIKEVLFARGR